MIENKFVKDMMRSAAAAVVALSTEIACQSLPSTPTVSENSGIIWSAQQTHDLIRIKERGTADPIFGVDYEEHTDSAEVAQFTQEMYRWKQAIEASGYE